QSGVSVILCTHQIGKVEQFCDRACILHKGRVVLYGGVDELIRSHSSEAYVVRSRAALGTLPGVASGERESHEENHGAHAVPLERVILQPGFSANEFLAALGRLSEPVESFSRERLPLEEIFIQVVESSGESVRDLLAEGRRAELVQQAKGV